MQINVNHSDREALDKVFNGIRDDSKKVLFRAINKTTATTMVQVRVKVGKLLNLTAARIRKNLYRTRPTFSHLQASVIAKGRPVGLVSFKARQLKGGVKVKVYKAGTAKLIKHAFIASGKRGKNPSDGTNWHVFWRKEDKYRRKGKAKPNQKYGKFLPSKYRLPLETKYGPRIEDILAKPSVFTPLNEAAIALFQKNVDAETLTLFKRLGQR